MGIESTIFRICSMDEECIDDDPCTIDYCHAEQNICINEIISCDECDQVKVSVLLTTDDLPTDTSYTITTYQSHKNSETMLSHKYYSSNAFYEHVQCFKYPMIYEFEILDKEGDGISCFTGDDPYQLLINDHSIDDIDTTTSFNYSNSFLFALCSSDADCDDNDCTTFDTCNTTTKTCTFEEISSSILSSCIECGAYIYVEVVTDNKYQETKWEITRIDNNDNNNMLVLSSQSMFEANQLYTKEKCLSAGTYEFTIFDSGRDGLSDGGSYKLYMNDGVIISGGQTFQDKESTTFEISNNIPSSTNIPSVTPTIATKKKKKQKKSKKKKSKKKKKNQKKEKEESAAQKKLRKRLVHRFPEFD